MTTIESSGGPGPSGEAGKLGPWFHNLTLPDGTQTAPHHVLGDFPAFKWRQLAPHLPEDLRGTRALDIGCNAGYYSFALARRGAHVVAIEPDSRYLAQAEWARYQYGLEHQVELRRMSVYDLARMTERFDLVLFLGVLYHLRYPLLGLDLAAERTRDMLVLQTYTMPEADPPEHWDDVPFDRRDILRRPSWPAMAFIEHRLAGDPTNWWVPNTNAAEAMMRSAGFEVTVRPGHEFWICTRTRPFEHQSELDAAIGRR